MEILIKPSSTATEESASPRRSVVAAWRAANTAMDAVFYDCTALSACERADLSAYVVPEGSIVVVHPRDAGAPVRILRPIDFVREQTAARRSEVDTIVVAGVGSSAVGTAALARNVADYLGRPVAGVVSGLGMADIVSEALGGWVVLGARNALRDAIARLLDVCEVKDHVRDQESHEHIEECVQALGLDKSEFIFGSPDSTILLYLLSALGNRIRTLVGHSKGNYSIDNALRGWVNACRRTRKPIPADVCIVTLGAVIRFPSEFPNVHQFIGTIDVFGMMNSRPFLDCEPVPAAWHSLNARLRGFVSVGNALQAAQIPAISAALTVAFDAEKATRANARRGAAQARKSGRTSSGKRPGKRSRRVAA